MKAIKKIFIIALLILMLSTYLVGAASSGIYGSESFILGTDSASADGGAWYRQPYGFFSIDDVDLSGVRSVKITAKNNMTSGNDGERVILRLDSEKGEVIGYVNIDRHCTKAEEVFSGALTKSVSGTHTVYFQSSIANNNYRAMTIYKVEFSKSVYKEEKYTPVPDSTIRNVHESTWALTDDLGRRVATYEETGPVREGKKVGIFY